MSKTRKAFIGFTVGAVSGLIVGAVIVFGVRLGGDEVSAKFSATVMVAAAAVGAALGAISCGIGHLAD